MYSFKKLQIALIGVVILIASYGYYTVTQMKEISLATENIFKHPLTVSNAVRDLDSNLLKIGILAGQITKVTDEEQAIKKLQQIKSIEHTIAETYVIIEQRYLGPMQDVHLSKDIFKQSLKQTQAIAREYYRQLSSATKNNNLAKEISNLEKTIFDYHNANLVIIEFAAGKATQIRYKSSHDKIILNALIWLIVILLLSLAIFSSLIRSNREVSEQISLIDQNIMTAKSSPNGKIIALSNALVRHFYLKKEDLINHSLIHLIQDTEVIEELLLISSSGKTYSGQFSKEVNGEMGWFHIHVEPKLSLNLEVKFLTIIVTDISNEKKIEEISIKDSLTGIFNRNYFELIFEKEIKKSIRDKKCMGILMLDIDFFKQFNDIYGHFQGDITLKSVAGVISKCTQRSYDIAFRVGGEEFLIIFSADKEELDECLGFAEKVRKGIENLQISHEGSAVSKVVTASVGYALLDPSHSLTPDEIYNQIDKNLYKAKHNGRNCSVGELIT